MKILRTIMAGALAVTLATACSDSTAPEDVTGSDLEGTWVATSVTFTPTAIPTPIEFLTDGAGFRLVLGTNTYTVTFTETGAEDEVESGTYTVSEGVITLTPTNPPGDPETFTIVSLSGSTLILSGQGEEEVEGVEVSGTLRIELARQ